MDVNRRNLIAGGVSLALADLLPGAVRASEKGTEVKFCVFADLHYAPRVFPNDTPEFLEKILKEVDKYCMTSIRPSVELKTAALGDDSVIYGALSMIDEAKKNK